MEGLAAIVNGGVDSTITTIVGNSGVLPAIDSFIGKTIKLTADLNMGGFYTNGAWKGPNYMPVGGAWTLVTGATTNASVVTTYTYSTAIVGPSNGRGSSFCGTFDGNGHTVSNINCVRELGMSCESIGLIGRLGVHDSDDESIRPTNPAVRNVVVKGYIQGGRSVGGIVGKTGKTTYNNTTNPKSGIGATIENCINYATVYAAQKKGVGGIVGAGWNGGLIRNCANMGYVSNGGSNETGGIAGSLEYLAVNCYNVGTVKAGSDSNALALGNDDTAAAAFINCYWLNGCAAGGALYRSVPATLADSAYSKTAAEMQSAAFVTALNGDGRRWVADTNNINNGYPILRFMTTDTSTLTSITKESDPTKLAYIEGQTFDATGLVIWANYSDSTKEKITDYTISKTTALATSDTTITISGTRGSQSYSYDFTITVAENSVDSISITTQPTNITYAQGECFNPAGMVVKATYANGTTATLASTDYTLSPDASTALTSGVTKVTVSYTYRAKTVTVDVPVTVLATSAPTATDGIYNLSTPSDMIWFANQVNTGTNPAIKGKLAQSIDLSSVTWTPIGTSATGKQYMGIFDGNSKTLTLALTSTNSYIGLFGYIGAGGTVKDLTLAGSVSGGTYTGSIAGYATGASLTGCTNTATISGSQNVGGIVGYIIGDATNAAVITGCVNNATVSGSSNYIGGIAGYINGTATISNCTNNAAVSSTASYAGGIVGYTTGTINVSGCTNSAAVTGTISYAGGIFGYDATTGLITACSNSGTISGGYHVGGIVGDHHSTGTLSSCSNSGSVTSTSTATSTAYSAGGIAGYLYAAGIIEQCRNSGNVTGGILNVGGIVGNLNNAAGKVTYCYNTGSITNSSTSASANVGSVVGATKNAAGYVQNCYNIGSVAFTAGTVASTNIGGVIGYATGTTNISNNYYLSTAATKGIGNGTDNTVSKTADTMKTAGFVILLNGSNGYKFLQDMDSANNGYAILSWQTTKTIPPVLTTDSTDNTVGNAIVITFTDNSTWSNAITGVSVNSTAVSGYTKTSASLSIPASYFATAGSYTITVSATGYSNALAAQSLTINTGTTYSVTVGTLTGGSVTTDKSTASAGDTVTLTVTPLTGKCLETGSLIASYNDGTSDQTLTLAAGENNTYTFIMPAYAVNVTAVFEGYYTVIASADASVYTTSNNSDGISVMTVNSGVSGLKDFNADVTAKHNHSGTETVVFAHFRNGVELEYNTTNADFDTAANTAGAGFNVQAGDIVKVYIVDKITNTDVNPIVLQ